MRERKVQRRTDDDRALCNMYADMPVGSQKVFLSRISNLRFRVVTFGNDVPRVLETKGFVFQFILALLTAALVFFRSRHDTALEILSLRQQIAVLKRKRPRPCLNHLDRVFWTTLRQVWRRWSEVSVVVKPETVVGWHRAGFRLFWKWRSRKQGGRPKTTAEIRTLIRRLAEENPTWCAPKIHGELQKLGFVVSETSVGRYLRNVRRRGDPAKKWLTFLANHPEVIAAFYFFTWPTSPFMLLYCFFVIEHSRLKILHFNVTRHPTA